MTPEFTAYRAKVARAGRMNLIAGLGAWVAGVATLVLPHITGRGMEGSAIGWAFLLAGVVFIALSLVQSARWARANPFEESR